MKENELESFSYDDKIVKKFAIATVIWGTVGMLVGVLIAAQMADWRFNFGLPWLTFGRLRPLHTNAMIFAFVGNGIFAGIYHSTQRLLKARLFSDTLSNIHFWGWQLIIVLAAITLPLGFTAGKEYAELEWPIDILITVVWVIFAGIWLCIAHGIFGILCFCTIIGIPFGIQHFKIAGACFAPIGMKVVDKKVVKEAMK